MSILVLGHKGMLGHMVVKYLRDNNYKVETVDFKFPTTDFYTFIAKYSGDYIINCIGAIPQKTKQFGINKELPIWLVQNSKCKVIHPGTDCEMDSDEYGMSKKAASEYIKDHSAGTKIIKASIIGPEIGTNYSLLNWFFSSESSVNGYVDAMWNGVTTLEWAKQCELLIQSWNSFGTETILSSECISKYHLLTALKRIFSKNIEIVKVEGIGSNKCLKADTKTNSIEVQLSELKEYYYKDTK